MVLTENYFALCLSIVTNKDPDTALTDLGLKAKRKFVASDMARIETMRKELLSWEYIGYLYGSTSWAIQKRVQRYKKLNRD